MAALGSCRGSNFLKKASIIRLYATRKNPESCGSAGNGSELDPANDNHLEAEILKLRLHCCLSSTELSSAERTVVRILISESSARDGLRVVRPILVSQEIFTSFPKTVLCEESIASKPIEFRNRLPHCLSGREIV